MSEQQTQVVTLPTSQPRITQETVQFNKLTIYLDDDINDPVDYREEIASIRSLTENDFLEIYINTNGGDMNTSMALVSAIRECQAPTMGHIGASAHSAGSFIFLACEDHSISEYAHMLIHCPRGGLFGTHHEINKYHEHSTKMVERFYYDIYGGFLKKKEIEKILDGQDLWLDAFQIDERLIKMHEKRAKEQARMKREYETMTSDVEGE